MDLMYGLQLKSAQNLFELIFKDHRDYPHYVFRGQKDASFDLEPGIIRNTEYLNRFYKCNNLDGESLNYRKYEYHILRSFIKACDKTGISIPGDGISLRRSFKLADENNKVPYAVNFIEDELLEIDPPENWPDDNSFNVMIMAQHHGLPTRLLDWTASLLTAMYFASVGGMEDLLHLNDTEAESRNIAIWLVDGKALNSMKAQSNHVLIKPPTSFSVNISPQEGHFTTLGGNEWERRSYILNNANVMSGPVSFFYLNIKESVSMYEICAKHGYTGAMIYPGLDGAAREVKETTMIRSLKQRFHR